MFTDLIIYTYCESYGITKERLSTVKKSIGGGRQRMLLTEKGLIHADYMRMCLAHYFRTVLQLPTKIAGTKAGYVSHSTVVHNIEPMNHYIKTQDPYVYPYWEKLMQVVKLYENTNHDN
jgi:hypothetical protein